MLPSYRHAMLFSELFDSELVQQGGHIFDRLLQVLRVALYQQLGDAASAVLDVGNGETWGWLRSHTST